MPPRHLAHRSVREIRILRPSWVRVCPIGASVLRMGPVAGFVLCFLLGVLPGFVPGFVRGFVPGPAVSAANGTIRGRVDLPAASPRSERRPAVAQVGGRGHRHEDADERQVSVVYLERAPRGAFGEPDERRVRMDQRNERFVPHVLAIPVGSVVDFPNNDATYHNVFSLSEARTFDLGRYAAGRSKPVRFDRPGIVRVFCDIHSHMNAFILVFAHRYFTVTDPEGRYRIDNVPSGTYTMSVWHEASPTESRQVTVPDSGGDIEVHFAPGKARGAP